MEHKHSLYDTDPHFVIDPITREIKNQSGKVVLMRYDHNSERFTFELPREIDGHDMSLCDTVNIHYINTSNSERYSGIYEVDDLQVYPDDDSIVVLSWLVSQNATRLAGKLAFIISFNCTTDSTVDYTWNTAIYSEIKISDGIYNGEVIIEQYADILHQWKQDLYTEGLKISSIKQTTTATADNGVNIITVTLSDGSTQTFQVRNGSKGNPGSSIQSIDRTGGNGSPGSIDTYTVTLTSGSTSSFQVYNGSSIQSIERTAGDGSPGSTDTYTITLTNGSTTNFQIYNGVDGKAGDGSGDMVAATYDPQGKKQDIFKYVDDHVTDGIDVDTSLSATSENPVQNKVIKKALDGKQDSIVTPAITGMPGSMLPTDMNVKFDDEHASYSLKTTPIELDEDALYYLQCDYYTEYTDAASNVKDPERSMYKFSKVVDGVVRWGSLDESKAITLTPTEIINNYRLPGHTTIVSIYKIAVTVNNQLNLEAINAANGHKAVAPGLGNASAEGYNTAAFGFASHSQNKDTMALGDYSSAEGLGTLADGEAQSVHGKYNERDTEGKYALIVGNGESDDSRSNAHTVDWDGNAEYAGEIKGKSLRLDDDYIKRKLGYLANGTEYNDLDESLKDGTYHRMWRLRFPEGSQFWGKLRIILSGGYHSHNASGVMSKDINLGFQGSSVYNNTGHYSSLGVAVETDFRISEAIWNTNVNAWEILIWQKNLYGNNGCLVMVEAWVDGSEYIDAVSGMSYIQEPEYVQDTTYESWGWMGDSSNNRTVNWDDQPVLESPYGERIITNDYLEENYLKKSDGESGGITSGTCTFSNPSNGDVTCVYYKQSLPDGKFAITLRIPKIVSYESSTLSTDVPTVLSTDGSRSKVCGVVGPWYSGGTGYMLFAELNSTVNSTMSTLRLYKITLGASYIEGLTTATNIPEIVLNYFTE